MSFIYFFLTTKHLIQPSFRLPLYCRKWNNSCWHEVSVQSTPEKHTRNSSWTLYFSHGSLTSKNKTVQHNPSSFILLLGTGIQRVHHQKAFQWQIWWMSRRQTRCQTRTASTQNQLAPSSHGPTSSDVPHPLFHPSHPAARRLFSPPLGRLRSGRSGGPRGDAKGSWGLVMPSVTIYRHLEVCCVDGLLCGHPESVTT